jgi:hypothetical protein
MANHDSCIHEHIIIPAETRGHNDMLQVDGIMSTIPQQQHAYKNTRQMGKLEGAKGLGYGMYPAQFYMLH